MAAVPDAREVGKRLTLLAKALGKTRAQLAADVGMDASAMSNFTTGRYLITPQWTAKLHARHGVGPDWLYLGIISGLPMRLAERIIEAETQAEPRGRRG
jgi:transcriptional regulator with XRE-family HTH domain